MRVAVIGTGRMGTALGETLASAGHEVRIGSRDRERGRETAGRIGAAFGGTYPEAADGAGTLVLAVPWTAIPATLGLLGDLHDRILIDVTNPFGDEQLHGSSSAEELQALVPQASVVKAFNTLYSEVIRRSAVFDGIVATVLLAGDDPGAKVVVARLVTDLGWEAVDAGPLSSSRYLEPIAPLMTTLDRMSGGRVEHAFRLLRRDAPPRPKTLRRRAAPARSG